MVETHSGRRFAVLFFALSFLVLVLGRWLQPVDHAVLSVAAPFEGALTSIAGGVGDVVSGVFNGSRLRDENLKLTKQNALLLQQVLALKEQEHENELLRRMLSFSQDNPHMDLLRARVIGEDPNGLEPYVIINRGTRDGLRKDMTVLDQNGYFVGRVDDAGGNAAKVLLLLSPSSSVGAYDMATRATGVVEGQYGARPRLRYVMSRAMLRRGDFILTSGQLNLYPRGLTIGQVLAVHRHDYDFLQEADIQPAADFSNLEVVQVVRNQPPAVPASLVKSP